MNASRFPAIIPLEGREAPALLSRMFAEHGALQKEGKGNFLLIEGKYESIPHAMDLSHLKFSFNFFLSTDWEMTGLEKMQNSSEASASVVYLEKS